MSRNLLSGLLVCASLSGVAFLPQAHAIAAKLASSPTPQPKPATTSPAGTSAGSTLTVEIAGLRNTRGQICFSVFSSTNPQAFPQDPDRAVINRCDKITGSPMVTTFKGLKPGNYAIAILHDENLNRKDDRNFLNVPTEGFGFSRNPAVRIKAPSFDEASIPVASTASTKINVTYLTNR
jgi:uncharacterized protein (DUF2141 family)